MRSNIHPSCGRSHRLVGASFQLISARVEEGEIDALLDLGPELAELAGIFEPIAA